MVEQGGGGLQGVILAAAEDLVEVEAQQPVVDPLAAFDQQQPAEGERQHPARRTLLAEDAAGEDVVPGLAEEGFGRRRLAVELEAAGLEGERVFALGVRVEHGFAPALHGLPDVTREDLGQVGVAVELVLVVDAGEGGGGLGGGSGGGHGIGPDRTGSAQSAAGGGVIQVSVDNSGMRPNSETLWVIKGRSSASAWAAIHRSLGPIGWPAAAKSARFRP